MKILLSLIMLISLRAVAQYAPPAGYAGTTAMHKDSSAFVGWATHCTVIRGWQDISDTSLGLATAGDELNGTDKAMNNSIVSLGDGGAAILTFSSPIADGPGADFAVFENAFNDSFLELAHVEVSSDGKQFFRFASQYVGDSLTQYTNNAWMDATKIHNLAGKYRAGFGTPFDLAELKGLAELDMQHITHVKLIDVVGSLNPLFATHDSKGRPINDPWPTPFAAGGFDLDAVGVINEGSWKLALRQAQGDIASRVYPNPCVDLLNVRCEMSDVGFLLMDLEGKVLLASALSGGEREISIKLSHLRAGIYVLKMGSTDFSGCIKVVKQ
ncbi:MAG: T9SS type A sorting domain-containing protein [Flavobacteriaceae bacterium]|nr:T9SS type A sorting domain-containing protein [Flavobacteriaceae bacterium]